MKKVLKIVKWVGLVILSLLLIALIYLGVIGFPKPSKMTTENVPRLPFSILKTAKNAWAESSNVLKMKGWSRKKGEGIYVMVLRDLAWTLAIIDEPGAAPHFIEGWESNQYGMNAILNPNPDKRYFLFTKDITEGAEKNQIFRFNMDTKETEMLSNGKDRYGRPRFTQDGERIIYSVTPENSLISNLYIRNIDDPNSERLLIQGDTALANRGFYVDDFSPDGKLVTIRIGYEAATPHIFNLDNGQLRALHPDHETKARYSYHKWSEDGNRIYYGTTYQADHRQLRVRDLISNTDSLLIDDLNWSISNINESPDGNWLVFNANEDGVHALYFYHLPTGKKEKFDAVPGGSVLRYTSFNQNQNALLAFQVTNPNFETNLYTYNLETKELKNWIDNFTDIEYPNPEMIHYPTFDMDSLTGETREISAAYFRPNSEITAPYPVIIWIHGGPKDQSRPFFDPIIKTYLDKGIVTIKPNVRGSTGYGHNFTKLDNGRLRENAVKDIGALLEWIEKNPELDENRVVVWGGSYGGYMSLATAVHYSDQLKAAVAYYGPTDFETFLGGADKNADRSLEYGNVNDPEMLTFLRSISPVNNADKIDIPVFIYQGAQDSRVKVAQSRVMVKALKEANKEYWYMEAANEGHFARNFWNMFYLKAAEMEFIDRALAEVD